MRQNLVVWIVVALGFGGCGGATSGQSEPARGPSPEELHQRRQGAMCDDLCQRLTACSLESARAELPPEEMAEIEKPEILARHTNECRNDCQLKELSPRQVKQAEACLASESACEPLLDCLDKAKPQP